MKINFKYLYFIPFLLLAFSEMNAGEVNHLKHLKSKKVVNNIGIMGLVLGKTTFDEVKKSEYGEYLKLSDAYDLSGHSYKTYEINLKYPLKFVLLENLTIYD